MCIRDRPCRGRRRRAGRPGGPAGGDRRMSAASARLDAELVRRGLARSRGRAAALVAQGRVRVGDVVARKASQPVPETAALSIIPDEATEYVSRAAHKLAGALDAINALASSVSYTHLRAH